MTDHRHPARVSTVCGKHATHDIFVNFDTKSVIDLLGDADTTELWIAALHLDDGRDELCGRAFRSRLSFPAGSGKSCRRGRSGRQAPPSPCGIAFFEGSGSLSVLPNERAASAGSTDVR